MNLPEWLQSVAEPVTIAPLTIAVRLCLALAAGAVIALQAGWLQRDRQDSTLPFTLMLMSVLIAMATQIIGDNIARAFSLVGALSIVRFRTAVPTTRDVAFVLASVVVGMAVGAGQLIVAGLGLGTVLLSTLVVGGSVSVIHRSNGQTSGTPSARYSTHTSGRLTLQAGLGHPDPAADILQQHCESLALESISSVRKGASLQSVYRVHLRPETTPQQLIGELNRADGIESLTWTADRGTA
ncbi:MAG: DUF4956 domain-containing protein [Planctomycetaceae bacterium]|nr:DUF4956 domain-containing protein [Planctomycetaceae bacterium]